MSFCKFRYILDKIGDSEALWKLGRVGSENIKSESIFWPGVDHTNRSNHFSTSF